MSSKKQIFKINTLKKLLSDENSCVSVVKTTRLLALPPFFLNDMKSGILYLLNNMLKKYDRSLGGIVIGYQNIMVLMDENTGIIPMGTSETEVNISVEFYIFQPRIGSFLEGVVNKKSNSHIGCLVHKYFNATILKPEDVDYDDWICHDFNVDDKIIFKVRDLDFTCLLPHIEGVIDDGRLLDKVKIKSNENCDSSHDFANNANKICLSKVTFSEERSKNEKENKSNKICAVKDNVNKTSLAFSSFTDLGKKKEKIQEMKKNKGNAENEEKQLLNSAENCYEQEKGEILDDKESVSYTLSKDLKVGEIYFEHKKNKKNKKKQGENVQNNQRISDAAENFAKGNATPRSSCALDIKDSIEYEDKRLSKANKVKKKKKKNIEELHAELNKTNQCSSANEPEDEIFYSTQLESSVPKKIKICCSPITKRTSFEEKTQKVDAMYQNDLDDKQKKSKHRKRKEEKDKEPQDPTGSKKVKTSHSSSHEVQSTKDKVDFDENKSVVEFAIEKLCEKRLDGLKKSFCRSGKESSKERKVKKRKLLNEEKEKLDLNIKKNQVNGGSETKRNSNKHDRVDELRKQELQRAKEELNISYREDCKEIKKSKKKEKESLGGNADGTLLSLNKSTEAQVIDVKKYSVREMMDQLLEHEMNRVKGECKQSEAKNVMEKKKTKKATNQLKATSKEKTHNSLFEKLLKEAKSAVALEESESSILSLAKKSKPKKKKDDSDLETSFNLSGLVETANQGYQKKKDFCETPVKYKNGNMYDAAITPEKVNFEKSLFSDSEQSNNSPSKRDKQLNGTETKVLEPSPFKKGIKDQRNVSENRKERKSIKSEQEQEFLYEKLLKDAKNFIQSRNECSPRKKKKHLVVQKNNKNNCKAS